MKRIFLALSLSLFAASAKGQNCWSEALGFPW